MRAPHLHLNMWGINYLATNVDDLDHAWFSIFNWTYYDNRIVHLKYEVEHLDEDI
jgi:hypothetical protein